VYLILLPLTLPFSGNTTYTRITHPIRYHLPPPSLPLYVLYVHHPWATPVSQYRFIQIVQYLNSQYVAPNNTNKLLFIFDYTREAAKHNSSVLASFNHDIHKAILAQPNSQLTYGSEFKYHNTLEELLQDHPNWTKLKELLQHGATFPLRPISHVYHQVDLNFHID
jgi:hypothetical protein